MQGDPADPLTAARSLTVWVTYCGLFICHYRMVETMGKLFDIMGGYRRLI